MKTRPKEPWIFSPAVGIKNEILSMKNSVRLGLLCNVSQGITIGGEGCLEIFSIKGRKVKIDSLESDVVCPVIGGGNVKRWKIEWDKEMLIYPYDENGKPIELGVFNEKCKRYSDKKTTE